MSLGGPASAADSGVRNPGEGIAAGVAAGMVAAAGMGVGMAAGEAVGAEAAKLWESQGAV